MQKSLSLPCISIRIGLTVATATFFSIFVLVFSLATTSANNSKGKGTKYIFEKLNSEKKRNGKKNFCPDSTTHRTNANRVERKKNTEKLM